MGSTGFNSFGAGLGGLGANGFNTGFGGTGFNNGLGGTGFNNGLGGTGFNAGFGGNGFNNFGPSTFGANQFGGTTATNTQGPLQRTLGLDSFGQRLPPQ